MVNLIKTYLLDLEEELLKQLDGVSRLDIEPIHDFRVCVKKMRTVLAFIEYWSFEQQLLKTFNARLRPLYAKTGKIRELQVHIDQLPVLEENTGLEIAFLEPKIKYQINRNQVYLQAGIKHFKKQKQQVFQPIYKQLEIAASGRTKTDAAMKYQKRLEKRVQKELDSASPDLHRIRRIFKQKVYVFDTFQESELLSFYKEFRAEWKILESAMGTWHDQSVFMEYLIRGLRWKRLKDEQYKAMMKLIAHLRSSTNRMEGQLIQSIPRLKD